MSQGIHSDIDPNSTTGRALATLLTAFKESLVSGHSGNSRPVGLQAGGLWVDTSLEASPNYSWSLKIYTGTVDLELFLINVLTDITGINWADGEYTVRKISADTAAPILNLIKQRVDTNGQVLTGDTLAEIRVVGRTDTGTDPLVAYLKVVAEENYTTSVSGSVLSMYSTPAGTNTALEHLRLAGNEMESAVAHKFNALIYGQESVAGSASMTLTSDKVVTEITGSTAVTVHGCEVGTDETRHKIIVNDTTQVMIVKHESGTASASERFTLARATDLRLPVNGSATFNYDTTASRWKCVSDVIQAAIPTMQTLFGSYYEWVAPFTGKVRITSYKEARNFHATSSNATSTVLFNLDGNIFASGNNASGQLGLGDVVNRSSPVAVLGGLKFEMIVPGQDTMSALDESGNAYAWGLNTNGQLGLGDVASRSSPVAVLGGLTFSKIYGGAVTTYALTHDGRAYSWGLSTSGELGVGDVTPRSSPVAVLGGLQFSDLQPTQSFTPNRCFGIQRDTGTLYAWGQNTNGELGVGDVVPRSSPVAVLGGLKFSKVLTGSACMGLTTSGALYAWGLNTNGQLGVGDVTPRSSPVAVLGGLVVADIINLGNAYAALTTSGEMYTWGSNANGRLGVGDTTPRSSPVAVLGGLTFRAIESVNGLTALGITHDGTLYAWGQNSNGQIGVGDVTPRSSPVAVLGGLKFAWAPFGYTVSVFGEATTGGIYAWGSNDNGKLGLGDTTHRSSPVLVVGSEARYFRRKRDPLLTTLDVVSGTTYKINLGGGICTFGPEQIGVNLSRITIAYES